MKTTDSISIDRNKMDFESEDQLAESFINSACPSLWTPNYSDLVVRTHLESTCSEGRADWVWAATKSEWPAPQTDQVPQLLQQPTCSRILAAIKSEAGRTEEYLLRKAGVEYSTFKRWMSELNKANLVSITDSGSFVGGAELEIPVTEIVSFEFKLRNWRRAFAQSKHYRSFSHRVFVVMPPRPAALMYEAIESIMIRFNIGLISHSSNATSEVLIPSKKNRPRSRADLIRAIGMLSDYADSKPACF